MDTRTVEQVNQWKSHPFAGGLAGLWELADNEFSGAVNAGGTWAFMLNGRVIGVFEGELEDFEDRNGTAYLTPDQALPLLFAMREQGGETQAKYYTNDTTLAEAHETLTGASFSGYVELSENVLSGDYYVAYYGGRSMSAAFVGESERLITGEEAFDRADDEVGIYEVKKVDLDVVDLSDVVEEPASEPEPEPEPESASESEPEPEPTPEPETVTDDEVETTDESEPAPDRPGGNSETPASTQDQRRESEQRAAESPAANVTTETMKEASGSAAAADTDVDEEAGDTVEEASVDSGGASQQTVKQTEDVFDGEQEWRETKAIPSLDPGRSRGRASRVRAAKQQTRAASTGTAKTTSDADSRPSKTASSTDGSDVEELQSALEESKQEIQRLQERLSQSESEQQELLAQREDLRSEIAQLKSQLEDARADNAGTDASTPAGQRLTPEEALAGTNLFVRYGSKSDPTLEDASKGADSEEVNANLKLEHHTQFDADAAVVDGREFTAYLHDSVQYRFVNWVVQELLYEIRDTGHVPGLRELFDALPRIDRAELDGTATIRKIEEGEEVRTQQTFDVIMRDRMGNPLLVANMNDDRDPATGDMMADLVSAANDVEESNPNLSAAVFVTASFFEPAALETAAEATGSGLLSREKKESFVKLSRKRGYHLCLVETRGGQFHVNVPEL